MLDVGLHSQPVIFCVDRAGVTGPDGPSAHGVSDMVLLTKVPGLTMLAPSSYQEVEEAAAALATSGTSATVYDVRCIKPLDEAMLADAGAHSVVVTIEDGLAAGGVGSMIAARLGEIAEPPRVRVLGLPDTFLPHGDPDELLAGIGLDTAGLVDEVQRLVS